MAGLTTAVVVVLVNGQEIIRTIVEKSGGKEEQEQPSKFYTLKVQTRDDSGVQRTELDVSIPDRIYVDAWIEAYGEGADPGECGPIQIELVQGHEYVSLTEGQPYTGGRTVVVQPHPQVPEGEPSGPAVVEVSAVIEGQPFSASVTIALTRTQYELEFR